MFISFEGPEGAGKTSQVAALADWLRGQGLQVFVTREPGGTAIGEQIRQVLTRMDNQAMHPRTEILLFQASRAQLVSQELRPRLAAGEIVLCDRYADATLAYQGYGHGVDLEILRTLIRFATDGLMPDLTFLLDLDVSAGLLRKNNTGEWNRLDAYDLAFHERVRQGYLKLAAAAPQRWLRVDASLPWDVVQTRLRMHLRARLNLPAEESFKEIDQDD